MVRPLRIEFACALHYVMARGNAREAIYVDDDRLAFLPDEHSRLVEVEAWSSDVALVTQTAYTLADRVAAITYPSGASASYTRDAVGRVTAVSYKASPTATAITLASGVTYYPFGPVNTLTYGNGRTLAKTYDQDYAIQTVASSDPTGVQLDPTIDSMGNLINNSLGIGVSPPTHTYSYDPLYRLTKVVDAASNPLATYSYNATGDRLSTSSAGQSATYTYAAGTHRLSAVGAVTRTYDNNGNLLSGNAGNQWTYDHRNRMATAQGIVGGAAASAVYNYNGKGERVVKSLSGGAMQNTVFLYGEGGQLLGEYAAGSGGVQGEYIYLDGVPLGYATAGTLYYVETDQLGTPHRLIRPGATTASDTMVWKWGSFGDPYGHVNMFGELAPGTQTVMFNLRFPGQYYDSETGLHYNYFRDYDPTTGRYVESDPIRLDGGIDTYAYVESGPLSSTDDFGLLRRGDGLTDPQWARLQQAEKRIQDELQKKDGCCIRTKNHFHERLASALAAQMIYYRPSLGKVNRLDICGLTYVGGRATTLDALAFQGRCTCLTATLYHELLHAVGLDHDNPNHPENPNDEVNQMTSACAPHLCGASK